MDERSLLRLSLLLSVAGLLALLFLSWNPHFDRTPIKDIAPEYVGRGVKVCGQVGGKFTSKGNHTFFTLDDGEKIKVVAFSSSKIAFNATAVCVIGTVDTYKGDLEITAKSVVEND